MRLKRQVNFEAFWCFLPQWPLPAEGTYYRKIARTADVPIEGPYGLSTTDASRASSPSPPPPVSCRTLWAVPTTQVRTGNSRRHSAVNVFFGRAAALARPLPLLCRLKGDGLLGGGFLAQRELRSRREVLHVVL